MSVDLQKSPRVVAAKVDRLPPSDSGAEQGILGCILQSPVDCLDECLAKLRPGAEVFFELRHQTLYQELVAMHERQRGGIDLITLNNRLTDTGKLRDCGGLAYVSSLMDSVHSAAGLDYYIQIVLEKYMVRKIIQTCTSVAGQAFEHIGDVSEMIGTFEDVARRMREEAEELRGNKTKPIMQAASEAIADWEWANEHRGQLTGISTGLLDLDGKTWGWQREDLIIIAARPSGGKSSLVFGFADVAAVDLRAPTLLLSLETSAKSVVKRIACRRARVSQMDLRKGCASEQDFQRLTVEMPKVTGAPLYIVDTKGLNINQVRSLIRRHVEQQGVKLVVVDYLQKIKPSYRHEKKTYEIAQVTEGLKAAAEEHEIPVIAACQLNRENEKQNKKPRAPRMSDLGDSGQIERDADVIVAIHNDGDDYFLIVLKMRDGPTGLVDVVFNKAWTRFDNATHPNYDHEHD